jgi:hypothetical protein
MFTDAARPDGQIVLETIQWTRLQFIEDLERISDQDYEVLKDLRDVLLRHGYQDAAQAFRSPTRRSGARRIR